MQHWLGLAKPGANLEVMDITITTTITMLKHPNKKTSNTIADSSLAHYIPSSLRPITHPNRPKSQRKPGTLFQRSLTIPCKKQPSSPAQNHQENVINAGFSASGNSKCDPATVAMGRIATKSVMCQLYGINGATAKIIMPTMKMVEKSIENLNCAVHTCQQTSPTEGGGGGWKDSPSSTPWAPR